MSEINEVKSPEKLIEELKKKVSSEDFLTTPINLANVLPLLKYIVLKLESIESKIEV